MLIDLQLAVEVELEYNVKPSYNRYVSLRIHATVVQANIHAIEICVGVNFRRSLILIFSESMVSDGLKVSLELSRTPINSSQLQRGHTYVNAGKHEKI